MNEYKLTAELIQQIEEYSSLMFSKNEIAEILEMPSQGFMALLEKDKSAYKAFRKGRLVQEAKLRKAIFDLAGNGSSPAQTLASTMIIEAKMND